MNTKDLIKNIVSGDKQEVGNVLNVLLKNKVKDEIDLKRVSVAGKIFNETEEDLEESIKTEDIEEGNEFTKAAAQAVIDGEEEFEFNGKTYKATISKDAAKKILGIKEDLDEAIDFSKITDDQLKGWLKMFKDTKKDPWPDFKKDVKAAKAELKKRGIKEETLKKKLKEQKSVKDTTVDKFFTGYFGTKKWSQTDDFTFFIDYFEFSDAEIDLIMKSKNKKIKVTSKPNARSGGFDTSFTLGKLKLDMETMDPVTKFA